MQTWKIIFLLWLWETFHPPNFEIQQLFFIVFIIYRQNISKHNWVNVFSSTTWIMKWLSISHVCYRTSQAGFLVSLHQLSFNPHSYYFVLIFGCRTWSLSLTLWKGHWLVMFKMKSQRKIFRPDKGLSKKIY